MPPTYAHACSEDGRDIILQKNPYSWSKSATVIYVDSPAGTGLSYSENPDTDYRTDDDMTTDDLLTFLQKLMATMPELSKQDFYIAGESYAGVYAPLLASKIVKKNDNAKAVAVEDEVQHWQHLNLKGYLLGNGVTDDIAEKAGQVEFAYGMGLMDPLTYAGLQDECDGDFWHVSPGALLLLLLLLLRCVPHAHARSSAVRALLAGSLCRATLPVHMTDQGSLQGHTARACELNRTLCGATLPVRVN
eukprot:363378-Chlamydomonas_euryale.AAC.14